MSRRLSVLLVTSSTELLGLIEDYLSTHDVAVTATSLVAVLGRSNPVDWIRDVNPDVVVFELSVPYDATWSFCETLRSDARVRAPFVVVTMNRSAVERLTPARNAIEIVNAPGDLKRVEDAVLAAVGIHAADAERRASDRRLGDRRREQRRANGASGDISDPGSPGDDHQSAPLQGRSTERH